MKKEVKYAERHVPGVTGTQLFRVAGIKPVQIEYEGEVKYQFVTELTKPNGEMIQHWFHRNEESAVKFDLEVGMFIRLNYRIRVANETTYLVKNNPAYDQVSGIKYDNIWSVVDSYDFEQQAEIEKEIRIRQILNK